LLSSVQVRFFSVVTRLGPDAYHPQLNSPGAGGITIANQIYLRFKAAGKALNDGDVAVLDAADFHNYQVRWNFIS
jgi:eukaryotic sulfide quinone oxidoreductase